MKKLYNDQLIGIIFCAAGMLAVPFMPETDNVIKFAIELCLIGAIGAIYNEAED